MVPQKKQVGPCPMVHVVIERQGFPYEVYVGYQCSFELVCTKRVMTAEEKMLVWCEQDGLDHDQMTLDVWDYGVEGTLAMEVIRQTI